jgi:uncharacterized protein (TIGR03066 family)
MVLGCSFLVLAGCGGSNKPQDLIIGKWQGKETQAGKETSGTLEFTKDGVLNIEMGPLNLKGKYKFIDDKNIETELSFMGQTKKDKLKVDSISNDKMVLVDPQGKKQELTRAK